MDSNKKKDGTGYRPVVGLALLSLLLCGLLFPLLITGLGQLLFPYQANGELVQFNGRVAGSYLIAQTFSQPIFFHPRNDSASGVDPDISVQDAFGQVARISAATGISVASLDSLINQNTDGVSSALGIPYVNVLALNLALISAHPSVYGSYG
ncbi:MAG: potassium-transporting ATPase subunit C [Nitrososphaerales archaeon]|nr:potassium-transporting ATPase subunit C [Nitrososphaerales archaeon]